ncbi:MAG: tRNA pseudouridine(55) synthase TruB [Cyanobacteria bacterium HKST-UBA06]|nr:tRNA pseudouridine(55) synthase TruB [Cyanobacteria bacterium HKST-UBA04]MCA9806729.1 tRNA pseudouridine(55) synthase TruB [Cyanobacteria bacterium HKST-UBA06]MCA9841196.1 tRNA pseudouridine(55) synthase TruB [Cyanobacteria bacterium HKST-UBA03]
MSLSDQPFGIVNVHKPLHCTSHDVVARLRKCYNLKKVGHAGTLDPLAEGVLPVCVGQATRLIEYLPSDKRYRAHITFGAVTTTWDAEADPLHPVDASHLTREAVETLLKAFVGTIEQTVPPHAAVHVNGKKLYELTRQGKTVDLPVRQATLYAVTLIDWLDGTTPTPTAVVEVHCASGTYIRSLAWALGQQAGTGAYLSGLVRTAHGAFCLEEAVKLDELTQHPNPTQFLCDPTTYLPFETLVLTPQQAQKLRHGQKLLEQELANQPLKRKQHYVLQSGTEHPELVGIGVAEANARLKPLKILAY